VGSRSAGEELGWRGFALPRMQARMHPLVASLVIGVFWMVWHLPAFYVQGSDKETESKLVFLAFCLAFTVLFSWVFNRTGGSVFHCVCLHAMINASQESVENLTRTVVDDDVYLAIQLGLYGGLALALIVGTRGRLGYKGPIAEENGVESETTRYLRPE
jgi:membrane protease YdiL (CAAX protease family)